MWRYCEKNSDVIWYCESQCEPNSSHIVTHIVRWLWVEMNTLIVSGIPLTMWGTNLNEDAYCILKNSILLTTLTPLGSLMSIEFSFLVRCKWISYQYNQNLLLWNKAPYHLLYEEITLDDKIWLVLFGSFYLLKIIIQITRNKITSYGLTVFTFSVKETSNLFDCLK